MTSIIAACRLNYFRFAVFRQPIIVISLLALSCAMFQWRLGERDLWASHEARAAQNAQFVLDTGHWGVLRHFDTRPEFQKPPLHYWLIAAVGWLHGGVIDEWTVRLPAAIGGVIIVMAISGWLLLRDRPKAAVFAATCLMTSNHFFAISRIGRIDVPLCAAITIAIFSITNGRWIVGAIALAIALLLKGPIGLAVILSVVIGWWLLEWRSLSTIDSASVNSPLRRLFVTVLKSMALGLCLAAPWYIAVGLETHWEFWRVFFWHHNIERATGSADDLARHSIWYYGGRWIIDWLPWSPFLVWGLIRASGIWRIDKQVRLGLAWMVCATALLTASQFKRADYLIVAYPGAAIVLGCVLERIILQSSFRRQRLWIIGLSSIAFASTAAYFAYEFTMTPRHNQQWEKRSVAASIKSHVAPGPPFIFFRVEDHLLAWHLGKPIATVMEWENLNIWVSQLNPGWYLMPAEEVEGWEHHINTGRLQVIKQYTDRSDRVRPRTWCLIRSEPNRSNRDF